MVQGQEYRPQSCCQQALEIVSPKPFKLSIVTCITRRLGPNAFSMTSKLLISHILVCPMTMGKYRRNNRGSKYCQICHNISLKLVRYAPGMPIYDFIPLGEDHKQLWCMWWGHTRLRLSRSWPLQRAITKCWQVISSKTVSTSWGHLEVKGLSLKYIILKHLLHENRLTFQLEQYHNTRI